MSAATVYVLKGKDGKYLAATYKTKFDHCTLGDLVPEQAYAKRFYDRNDAARVAVEGSWNGGNFEPRWRVVRLMKKVA